MTHGKRIRTGLGIVAALLVVAAPAGATTITVVRDVSARDAAMSAATEPMQVVRDVSARDARLTAGDAAIAYFKANELATQVDSAGPAAIAYFKANERATMNRGGEAVAALPNTDVRAARASGFDWIAAGVGASSALLVVFLVGVSLLAARHLWTRPLAQ
jgi:hypothetical protein